MKTFKHKQISNLTNNKSYALLYNNILSFPQNSTETKQISLELITVENLVPKDFQGKFQCN